MRSTVLHFEPGTTNVDGFACSSCAWCYVLARGESDGTFPHPEVDSAHASYSSHRCSDFPEHGNRPDQL